ncbi:MAG TPA: TadE/TadG family type IV pilus assembly protein [Candidatus Limnocylindrales bacterium]
MTTTQPCSPRPACAPARRGLVLHRRRAEEGQGLVEFALVLTPLLLLLLGIVQFGFIFNTYITVTSAAREAARSGSIYVFQVKDTHGAMTATENDTARNDEIKASLLASLNGLSKTAPNFANGTTWTSSINGTITTFVDGDITITYDPGSVTANDPRQGYRVTVRATYHQDIIIPMISDLLPHDAGGRLPLTGEVTMVVN